MLERVRVILVRPQRAGNVGSASRALMNMGLRDLVLVAPECDWLDDEALRFAARARPVLEAARVVPTIAEAQADCVMSFATSGKGGLYRRNAGLTAAAAAPIALRAAVDGPVAIGFGPEDRGLLQEETLQFDHVVEIPSAPEYPALNLAAAVAVIAYELRCAWMSATIDPSGAAVRATLAVRDQPLAPDERKQVMFEHLFRALDEIGFFRGQQNPDHLKFALRHLLGRAALSVNEADILIGMARQISWTAARLSEARGQQ